MEAHSSKSNRKRQREQENQPCAQRKRQPLSISSDESVEPMKITGLIVDCLLKIFEYLDLRSLFNVAVANGWLRPVANDVYKRRFGMKTVDISNDWFDVPFESSPYHITITGLKSSLQFLRCLGSSINGLDIQYSRWNGKQCEYIHQYVNKYCAESLSKIKFSDKPKSIPIGPFEKPFVNVRTVELESSDLHNQWPAFAEWFPNMQSLKLKDVRTSHRIDLSKFDHLIDLSIYVPNFNYGDRFTMNEATQLIQQLPHLHSLYIWGSGFKLKQLLNIIKNHRDICNLKVTIFDSTVATSLDIQQLINEHPMLIELELIEIKLALDTIISLISQLNTLKRFQFQLDNRLEYDRLVGQLDGQWRSSFDDSDYGRNFVELKR